MSDTASLAADAEARLGEMYSFYQDTKAFLVHLIDLSIVYAAIIRGDSTIRETGFTVGIYRVCITDMNQLTAYKYRDADDNRVTVYKFELSKKESTRRRLFGGEKIIRTVILRDHFYEPEGTGPRDTRLFRCNQITDNVFNLQDIPSIRDYMDTLQSVLDISKAYTSF